MQASGGGQITDSSTGLTLDQMILLTIVVMVIVLISVGVAGYFTILPTIKKLFANLAQI